MKKWSLGIILAGMLCPVFAADISFVKPVECEINKECYIHKNPKSEGFKRVVFALPSFKAMEIKDYKVFATNSGTITRVIKNVDDNEDNKPNPDQEDRCGNGIMIEHAGGWVTQYCHLKRRSIDLKVGDKVTAGMQIGLVGASGIASEPQVEVTFMQNGEIVDPFAANLWNPPIEYKKVGLIDFGLYTNDVPYDVAVNAAPKITEFHLDDNGMIAWVRLYGVKAGDLQKFTFYQPDGKVYKEPITAKISKASREWYSYGGFPIHNVLSFGDTGKWRVTYEIKQGDADWQTIAESDFTID